MNQKNGPYWGPGKAEFYSQFVISSTVVRGGSDPPRCPLSGAGAGRPDSFVYHNVWRGGPSTIKPTGGDLV